MKIVEKKNEMFFALTPQEVALLIESLGAQLANSHGGGVINQPFKVIEKGVVVKNIYIVQKQTTDGLPDHDLENEKKLITEWQENVYSNAAEVDPNNEFCWKSLAMGFALSKGLDTEKSWNFVQTLLEKGII